MKITITENAQKFDQTAAWRIIAQVLKKPNAVIGLSTGQTTIEMHHIVSNIYQQYPFDVSKITLFNVDEYANVPSTYEGTCRNQIYRLIAGPLGIAPENFIMPATESTDFKKECELFERRLAERGGVDLQLLGIGPNGHVGFNQPGTPLESETLTTTLLPEVEEKARKGAQIPEGVVISGLTRGLKNIMRTRHLILVAKGKHKAEIIEKAVFGPVTTDIPASIIQLHPNCEVLLDADAGALIYERAKAKGFVV